MLPQRVKMRSRCAKLRIRQRELSAPGFIGELNQRARRRSPRQTVRINDQPAAPISKSCPSICFAKNILRRQLPCAHFFVPPEHIALRVTALGEQPISQPNRLYRFTIIHGANFYPGGLLNFPENRLSINPILCAINNCLLFASANEGKNQCNEPCH